MTTTEAAAGQQQSSSRSECRQTHKTNTGSTTLGTHRTQLRAWLSGAHAHTQNQTHLLLVLDASLIIHRRGCEQHNVGNVVSCLRLGHHLLEVGSELRQWHMLPLAVGCAACGKVGVAAVEKRGIKGEAWLIASTYKSHNHWRAAQHAHHHLQADMHTHSTHADLSGIAASLAPSQMVSSSTFCPCCCLSTWSNTGRAHRVLYPLWPRLMMSACLTACQRVYWFNSRRSVGGQDNRRKRGQ